MPITMLDSVDFSKVPALQFVVPVVGVDPTGLSTADVGRLIYNSTDGLLKYCIGVPAPAWIPLGAAGAGAPPTGTAAGDLSGTYPSPQIKADVIVDADINTAAAIQQSKILNLGASLTAKQSTSEKGQPNGYVPLDSSTLIPTTYLPPLAVNDVFTASSDAGMQGLNAQTGDMCIRTDTGKTYVLSASPASTLANWKEIMAAGAVQSVNGQTGVVSLTASAVGAPPTTRNVIAGNGLTGGGDLSADRTINLVGDANLNVLADQVGVLSAPKWTTARTVTLTGDVTGTASVDGSANVSLSTSVVGGVAPKHYAGDVGGGTSVTVPHGLGTRDIHVTVYRNTAPWDTILTGVERPDLNNVVLRFASAVSAAQFRVVIEGK